MKSRETKMARVRKVDGSFHRFAVTDLADHNYVRCLANSSPQRFIERLSVKPEFPLSDEAFLMFMHELNGIFDRDDMTRAVGVPVSDHGCHGRGFSHPSSADNENQPSLFDR